MLVKINKYTTLNATLNICACIYNIKCYIKCYIKAILHPSQISIDLAKKFIAK